MRISVFILAILIAACSTSPTQVPTSTPRIFDGNHAYQEYVLAQMKIGIRPAGSAAELAQQGWRFSAHTHPGYGMGTLIPSSGDRAVLSAMGQSQSSIYNSFGEYRRFNLQGVIIDSNWLPR